MDKTTELLQVSAKLYQHLQQVPVTEKRDRYVEEIDRLLEERGTLIELMRPTFNIDQTNRTHNMLVELDKGIQERLQNIMNAIKHDMKVLQVAKKNEKQYVDPYSNVAVMDGRYYDKKN